MGLKKGTKLTDNPKTVKLGLRLTPDESKRIQDCADALQTTRTDAIMQGIGLIEDKIKTIK